MQNILYIYVQKSSGVVLRKGYTQNGNTVIQKGVLLACNFIKNELFYSCLANFQGFCLFIGRPYQGACPNGCFRAKLVLNFNLTILTGKTVFDCVLLNSVQEFIEMEAWLLLNFFLYLHSQLISIHSIVAY